MKWVTGVILMVLVGWGVVFPAPILADGPSLLIVALQTGSATSASDEYIELANISDKPIDLTNTRLEYFSAVPKSFTTPSRTIKLQGSVAPQAHYLLTATNYRVGEGKIVYSPTLASSGGHLRLMNDATELDFVGWGTASGAHGQPASAPPAGKPLLRLFETAGYSQTGDNSLDFGLEDKGTIQSTDSVSPDLELSEILPDPAAPATDATGEYIEVHNTGTTNLKLADYSLRIGTKRFAMPNTSLPPDDYLAFYAPQTKLTLSNSGTTVQLLAGTQVLDEVTYPKATTGNAWSWDGTGWLWTTKPTPNSANIFEATVAGVSTAKLPATKKKVVAKKSNTLSKKKSTKKTAVAGASTSTGAVVAEAKSTNQPTPLHSGVLAGVGSLAVLYGAYEYRQDIGNTFRKLRRNRGDRT